MPRYFFNIEGVPHPLDGEGTHLKGPDQACAEAVAFAGAMLRDFGGRFWNGAHWRMQVTDEEGRTVCTLRITGERGETHP